ncbi:MULTISPECIES: antitoxin Xre/MbcA/ParS toxin-binding domain-containing protein [Pseudomonas]|jgi:uncharacterized protein (DUF2384 family)|uniref:antitoxin Xre/MbcA/ParS toxin-binding domain-containing protein n=1 Tax=Pseudomonas TaxID=286 RepID=UPI0009AC35B3
MDDSRAPASRVSAPFGCWSGEYRGYLVRRELILEIAERVLGTHRSAEYWLGLAAFGLGGQVPCDLLRTQVGYILVKELLGRIEYGVYT